MATVSNPEIEVNLITLLIPVINLLITEYRPLVFETGDSMLSGREPHYLLARYLNQNPLLLRIHFSLESRG